MPDKQLQLLIAIYQHTKNLVLFAEEYNTELKSFLQPTLEQRNAYEHLMRVLSYREGLKPQAGEDYESKNIHSAIRHQYRAFFDIADFVAIAARKRLIEALTPYSNSCINVVIPAYYTEIRSNLQDINIRIRNIRDAKDIGSPEEYIEKVEAYKRIVEELFNNVRLIEEKIPALEEFTAKEDDEQKREQRNHHIGFVIGVVGALIGLAGIIFSLL